MYQCPKCHSDKLEVVVKLWAKVTQADGNVETEPGDDGSHEWDGNSPMVCKDCGHGGKARQFKARR